MNMLKFAKLKNEFKVLPEISGFIEMEEPVIQNEISFVPDKKCHDDEWFYICIDNEHRAIVDDYLACVIKGENNELVCATALNEYDRNDFSDTTLFFHIFDGNKIVFKKIDPKKRLANKKFIIFNYGLHVQDISGIELDDTIGAYFDGVSKLYFRSFSRIKSMFKGVEFYYREASKEEINKFKQLSIVKCASDLTDFGQRNVHLLALVNDDEDIDLNNSEFTTKLVEDVTKYQKYVDLEFDSDSRRFIINTREQLKNFLNLALGRLYENPMTGHKMVANSASKID